MYAWGDGFDGELGDGSTLPGDTPVVVSLPSGVTPTAIAGSSYNAYAIGSDGNLYAWGPYGYGSLGNGESTVPGDTPVVVSLPAGSTPLNLAGGEGFSAFAIVEAPNVAHITITTISLPPGTVGVPYSVQLEAVGGTPPYTWNKYLPKGMGKLPLGVILSKSGLISGTPKRAGTYTFTVKCLDASHSHKTQATQALTLTINP